MSTSSTTSAAAIPTLSFNGISQYASQFQSILNNAVQQMQIPVTQLQNQDSAVLSQETALSSLNTDVGNLASSLQALGTLAQNQALGATSSDPDAVSAVVSGATTANSYTINSITSVASAASEVSTQGYADSSTTPVVSSPSTELELVAGSFNQTFTLTNNTLQGLTTEINSLNAGVTASILTTSTGNYLSVTANQTGATNLQLLENPTSSTPTNLLTANNQGSDAVFELNGIPVDQSSNTVNSVVPGVTFTIQQKTSTPVTLSLQSDPTQLSSALQTFVTDYNQVQSDLNAQRGASAGALAGDTVIDQLSTALQQIAGQTLSTGSIQSLSDLGITFNDSGVASFDQSTFDALTPQQISDAFNYIGSTTTGLGGFSQTLTEFSDPVTGLIETEETGLQQTDQDLQSQISTLTTRNQAAQTALTQQLEAADAAQADLQNQQQELTASLQAVSLVLYGKSDGTT